MMNSRIAGGAILLSFVGMVTAHAAPATLNAPKHQTCLLAEGAAVCDSAAGSGSGVDAPKPLKVQQTQSSYKYYCTIQGPPDVARNWVSQGRGQQPIMFATTAVSVYFLGGVAQYTVSGNLVTWRYIDNFSQQPRTASFDTATGTLQMEGGAWACAYAGPGP